ncbi:hypothetical protein BKA81DRAFT_92866 [Phyllosticta paracitricarpa]|uniref:Uncharacterized protein n=1 Tax=Phyllosticta paracitricarpa TaxID=2016321 RepID=A0ABR1MYL5_9PEZI
MDGWTDGPERRASRCRVVVGALRGSYRALAGSTGPRTLPGGCGLGAWGWVCGWDGRTMERQTGGAVGGKARLALFLSPSFSSFLCQLFLGAYVVSCRVVSSRLPMVERLASCIMRRRTLTLRLFRWPLPSRHDTRQTDRQTDRETARTRLRRQRQLCSGGGCQNWNWKYGGEEMG